VDDGICVSAIIGEHVVGDRHIWSELVCSGSAGTRSSSYIDIGAVRVESEFVDLSQTSASVEWS